MKCLLSLITSMTLCVSPALFANTATSTLQIEKAIYAYFEGHGTANRALLEQAFAVDVASMVGAVKNEAGNTEIKVWKDLSKVVDRWSSNPNPGGANRDGEIISLSVVDGRLATVIFRFTDEYYDAFTLVKLGDGTWKITNKTFVKQ